MLHLEYLYASPLDLASLDVRAEIEALATIPGVNLTVLVLGYRRSGGGKEVEEKGTGGKYKGRRGSKEFIRGSNTDVNVWVAAPALFA